MKTNYFEDYVKEILEIPKVDFEGLKVEVIKEMVLALELILERYPALKKSICAIGPSSYITNQINIVFNSKKQNIIYYLDDPSSDNMVFSLASFGLGKSKKLIYVGIAYGKKLIGNSIDGLNRMAEYDVSKGFHPKHCTNFKSYIYHEIGHILYHILRLEDDRKFMEMIELVSNGYKNISSDISKYAESNNSELVAEAFAEYIMCPTANKLVNSIGKYIDEKYKRYEHSYIFNINKRYKIPLNECKRKKL